MTDHVFPRLPVRQWVLCVPNRLRYYMQRDGAVLNMVLRIFLRVMAQSLQDHCPGSDKRGARLDALHLTPLELIVRIAALATPAHPAKQVVVQTEPANMSEGMQISKILDHIGVDSQRPQISPARGPRLWDDCSDAQTDEAVHIEPDWHLAAQPVPDFELDQRVNC